MITRRIPTLGDLLAMVEDGRAQITGVRFVRPDGSVADISGSYTFKTEWPCEFVAERAPQSNDDGEGDCG